MRTQHLNLIFPHGKVNGFLEAKSPDAETKTQPYQIQHIGSSQLPPLSYLQSVLKDQCRLPFGRSIRSLHTTILQRSQVAHHSNLQLAREWSPFNDGRRCLRTGVDVNRVACDTLRLTGLSSCRVFRRRFFVKEARTSRSRLRLPSRKLDRCTSLHTRQIIYPPCLRVRRKVWPSCFL